jgi:hypothetical protein
VIEELAEFRELLIVYLVEAQRDLGKRLHFAERTASYGNVVCILPAVRPAISLNDIRRD